MSTDDIQALPMCMLWLPQAAVGATKNNVWRTVLRETPKETPKMDDIYEEDANQSKEKNMGILGRMTQVEDFEGQSKQQAKFRHRGWPNISNITPSISGGISKVCEQERRDEDRVGVKCRVRNEGVASS